MFRTLLVVDPISSALQFAKHMRERSSQILCVSTFSEQAQRGPLKPFLSYLSDDKQEFFKKIVRAAPGDSPLSLLGDFRDSGIAIDGILAGSDHGVAMTDVLTNYSSLPGNDPRTSSQRYNKLFMKQACESKGISVPAYLEWQTALDFDDHPASSSLSYPRIIKPACGAASRQVYYCKSKEELRTRYDQLRGELDVWGNKIECVLVEEFIGDDFVNVGGQELYQEYQVNLFSNGLETIVTDLWLTQKLITEDGSTLHFNEYLIHPGGPQSKVLEEFAIAAADAVGIKLGPSHAEIRMSQSKGPVLIEIAARFAGGCMPKITATHSSFDPFVEAAKVACGSHAPLPPVEWYKEASIISFPALASSTKGTLTGIEQGKVFIARHGLKLFCVKGEDGHPTDATLTTDLTNFPATFWLVGDDAEKVAWVGRKLREIVTL